MEAYVVKSGNQNGNNLGVGNDHDIFVPFYTYFVLKFRQIINEEFNNISNHMIEKESSKVYWKTIGGN